MYGHQPQLLGVLLDPNGKLMSRHKSVTHKRIHLHRCSRITNPPHHLLSFPSLVSCSLALALGDLSRTPPLFKSCLFLYKISSEIVSQPLAAPLSPLVVVPTFDPRVLSLAIALKFLPSALLSTELYSQMNWSYCHATHWKNP